MKDLASYVRLFRETSPFVGSMSKAQAGIRSALRLFSNEYQYDDAATDSVTRAIKENMLVAVNAVAELTKDIRTLVDYNAFIVGGKDVPDHVFDALVKHHLLLESVSENHPEKLNGEYCGKMIWLIADSLMKGSLQDLCAAAMADKKEGGVI